MRSDRRRSGLARSLRGRARLRAVASSAVLAVAALTALAGCQAAGEEPAVAPVVDSTPAPTPPPMQRYVAMGDSYTAAPLFPLKSINSCLRSRHNYPALVGRRLDLDVTDVSCSGATTGAVVGRQEFLTGKTRPPQIHAIGPDTDLVTIGIGANDFQFFSQMIVTCLRVAVQDPTGSPCRDANRAPGGADKLEQSLGEITTRVVDVVGAIREAAPSARVLVIGYPQLLPDTGSCRNRLPLAEGDYPYARDLNLQLSDAVRAGAEQAGGEFVDLVEASRGHDICSAEPWVAGVRGDPRRAMGLHPYPAEQRAVANLLVKLL